MEYQRLHLRERDIVDNDEFLNMNHVFKFPKTTERPMFITAPIMVEHHIINGGYSGAWLVSCGSELWVAKTTASRRRRSSLEMTARTVTDSEMFIHNHQRIRAATASGCIASIVAVGEFNQLDLPGAEIGTVLFFDYFNAGDVCTLVANISERKELLPEGLMWDFLCQAVRICHILTMAIGTTERILHCDIKPDNVGIHIDEAQPWPILKLADWGLSRVIGHQDEYVRSNAGVPPYNAPENAEGRHSPSSDLWCFIHVIYIIAAQGAPARPRKRGITHGQAMFKGFQVYTDEVLDDRTSRVVIHPVPYSKKLNEAFAFLLDPTKSTTPRQALAYLDQVKALEEARQYQTIPRHLFRGLLERNGFEVANPQ